MKNNYEKFQGQMNQLAVIGSIGGLLAWDNEVYKPSKAEGIRAQQNAFISALLHEKFTNVDFENLVAELQKDATLNTEQKINVEKVFTDIQKQKKFSKEFVEKQSHIISEAFGKWHQAKTQNDFSLFEKSLEQIVALSKESAELFYIKPPNLTKK